MNIQKLKENIYNFLTLLLAVIFIVGGIAFVKFYPEPQKTENIQIYVITGSSYKCEYKTQECLYLCLKAVDRFSKCKERCELWRWCKDEKLIIEI